MARDKITVRLERLRELGHELRRPEADYVKNDIYELRVKANKINHRILYFFHGRQMVVLAHGFVKQQAAIPEREMRLAVRRRAEYLQAPRDHTYKE